MIAMEANPVRVRSSGISFEATPELRAKVTLFLSAFSSDCSNNCKREAMIIENEASLCCVKRLSLSNKSFYTDATILLR